MCRASQLAFVRIAYAKIMQINVNPEAAELSRRDDSTIF
jgi:hypothetical protein